MHILPPKEFEGCGYDIRICTGLRTATRVILMRLQSGLLERSDALSWEIRAIHWPVSDERSAEKSPEAAPRFEDTALPLSIR